MHAPFCTCCECSAAKLNGNAGGGPAVEIRDPDLARLLAEQKAREAQPDDDRPSWERDTPIGKPHTETPKRRG